MAEKVLTRKEVDPELTWKLEDLYPNEEAMFADLEKALLEADRMEGVYRGKLDSAKAVADCLRDYQNVHKIVYVAENYAELAQSVDYQDQHLQDVAGRVSTITAKYRATLSFIDVEVGQCDEAILREAITLDQRNAGYIKKLLRHKPHMLSPETEKALAALENAFDTPYEVYNVAKLGDMKFPDFTVEGKSYPLGYSLFEDDYEYEENTAVRRAAFDAFSEKLLDYVNVTATAYNSCVQTEKAAADLRGHKDVYDFLLLDQCVTRDLYDRQINVIMEELAPHMRKYAKLIQKLHHLDKMTYADLKLPVDSSYSPKVTIPEAKDYILKGLSVMGEEYEAMLKEALDGRWVDFAKNLGKSTGGFCASPYGNHSYILLNWNDRMSDVFTLAHELGHAGHFKLCNEVQSLFDTEVSTYFVEAPSTMNEILMAKYLLKTSDDKRFRRWVIANMIGNTYYHNFVTHLLEAAYQREVYAIADKGGSLQADTLSDIMKNVLEKFWGGEVELTKGAELTWMRQPHYYMGLYSYTYSAGLTIATQVAERIEREGEIAVADWKKVLTAGGTLDPVEFACQAGVDIRTDEPLKNTIATIGSMIDELWDLSEQLGEI
ncbi:MAG: oligoendopeptidase F [Lachnospiraceae bacterium]|nr:oligoendopeptidase F [Lachnospiraceae bacterium]